MQSVPRCRLWNYEGCGTPVRSACGRQSLWLTAMEEVVKKVLVLSTNAVCPCADKSVSGIEDVEGEVAKRIGSGNARSTACCIRCTHYVGVVLKYLYCLY